MKKIAFLLIAMAAIFAACDKEDNGRLDPNAKIYIKGATKTNKNLHWNVGNTLSVHEICLLDSLSCLYNTFIINKEGAGSIDTINDRLVMEAANLGDYRGSCLLDVDAYPHFVITRSWYDGGDPQVSQEYLGTDTVAYVPQALRREAYNKIAVLWENGEWDEIYAIFLDAFEFYPITGEELRALIDEGLE